MVSHELKTPVTSLKVLIHMLENKFANKKNREDVMLLGKMKNQTNKLIRLINDLLDINRMGNNQLLFNDELFRFDEVVKEIIDDLQQSNPTHKIEYADFPVVEVFGDKDRIGQVVINLVLNAIKYSPLAKTVIVDMHTENNTVICSVKDSGIGIEADEQGMIFDRFYRAKNDNVLSFPGLGMGLYISSEIIKKFHGMLWVKSRHGEGSVFYFSVPIS